MLIDWITAYLPMSKINESEWQKLILMTERVMRFKPDSQSHSADDCFFLIDRDSVVYETSAWESVRSDSHQIAFKVGGDSIYVQGSPARLCGSGDAVFGEGAAAALDLTACVHRMAAFVASKFSLDISLNPDDWHVTRIDVTGSLLLDDLAAVREALRVLRNCEGGRYRVSQQAGDTVYWSHKSRLKAGKAYAKGPHIDYSTKRPDYTGREYTDSEKQLVNRLLRLELRLGAQWIRERAGLPWQKLTPEMLIDQWKQYFNRMIGDTHMKTTDDVKARVMAAAKTEGQGKAAYCCFLMIQSQGWENARNNHTKPSWYRHLKILRAAGLGDADISAGKVVQLRRKIIECQVINSWSDFKKAA
ncbi:hypothetical protein JCM14076_15980 [Methylosoma difficile]